MTDKVQKIREEVERIQLYTQSEVLKQVLDYIDKVQKEEPIREDLEEAAKEQARSYGYMTEDYEFKENVESFKTGAQWRKKQMMAKALDEVIGFCEKLKRGVLDESKQIKI